jgi:hypothetical protein
MLNLLFAAVCLLAGATILLGIILLLSFLFATKPKPMKDPNFFIYEPIDQYKNERKYSNPHRKA